MKIADLEPRGAAVSDEELWAVLTASLEVGRERVTITGLTLAFEHWVSAARWVGCFQGKWASQELRAEHIPVLVTHDDCHFLSTAARAQTAVRQVSESLAARLARLLGDYEARVSLMAAPPRTVVHAFGLAGRVFLYSNAGPGARTWLPDSSARALDALAQADLLLNVHDAGAPSLIALARCTALVDIDPGLPQLRMRTGMLEVPARDVYFSAIPGSVGQ